MYMIRHLTALSVLLASSLVLATDTPIIGILAQENHEPIKQTYPNHTSYIAASYVKNIEAAGARVVPILIGQGREYYVEILSRINGVLLPGGGVQFTNRDGYADAGRHILHIVEMMNQQGQHLPVLAICLGFELLLQVSNNDTDFRTSCEVQNLNLKLEFLPGSRKSSLFSRVSKQYFKVLAKKNITHNNHIWCLTEEDMIKYHLTETWKILSNSKYESWSFVSTVEHKSYPFVGLQFHPEKNAYEWTESQHNVHSYDAIVTARIFSDWFIEEAKLNNNSFPSQEFLYKSLIQNYDHVITFPQNVGFEQIYLFK